MSNNVERLLRLTEKIHSSRNLAEVLDIGMSEIIEQLVRKLEEDIPVCRCESLSEKPIVGYVLLDNQWFPVHDIQETIDGYASYTVNYSNGDSKTGIAKELHWCGVYSDGTPAYQWFDIT